MTIQEAIKLALAALAAGDKAVEAMKKAGNAFKALESEKGAKKAVAEAIAEKRGITVKTAQNYIAACIKAYVDGADSVRAAYSVKKKDESAPSKFSAKDKAAKVTKGLTKAQSLSLAKQIAALHGVTITFE